MSAHILEPGVVYIGLLTLMLPFRTLDKILSIVRVAADLGRTLPLPSSASAPTGQPVIHSALGRSMLTLRIFPAVS